MLVWDWPRAPSDVMRGLGRVGAGRARRGHDVAARMLAAARTSTDIPEPLRGRKLVVDRRRERRRRARGRRGARPAARASHRSSTCSGPMPAAALVRLHGDPEEPMPATSASVLLDALDEAGSRARRRAALAAGAPRLMCCELRQLGGALGRPAPGAGALSHLDGAVRAVRRLGIAPDAGDGRRRPAPPREVVDAAWRPGPPAAATSTSPRRPSTPRTAFDPTTPAAPPRPPRAAGPGRPRARQPLPRLILPQGAFRDRPAVRSGGAAGRGRGSGVPAHPQRGRLAEHRAARRRRALRSSRRPGRRPRPAGAGVRLQARQVIPKADVRAGGEGQVAPRVRAARVEAVRVREGGRVAVGGGEETIDEVPAAIRAPPSSTSAVA